jgi:hypothetical protein
MGDRDRNVGQLDRLLRVPLGVSAVLLAGWILFTYPITTGMFVLLPLSLLAAVLLISAKTGTCGIYKLLGINTCESEDCVEDGPEESWTAE